MYEAWKILKKNPFIWNPRAFAYITIGFFSFGVYRQVVADKLFAWEHYEEDHPEDQHEAMRQWAKKKNIHFREYVLAERAKQDQQLRLEAGLH